MRKIISIMAVACLALSLVACGGQKEVKGASVLSNEQGAVKTTMTLDAKGDMITQINQRTVVDKTQLTEEQIQMIMSASEQAESTYAEIKKIKYSLDDKDGKIVEDIVIPTDKETLKAVIEKGLLPVTGGDKVEKLSLKETKKTLEGSGWKVEK